MAVVLVEADKIHGHRGDVGQLTVRCYRRRSMDGDWSGQKPFSSVCLRSLSGEKVAFTVEEPNMILEANGANGGGVANKTSGSRVGG